MKLRSFFKFYFITVLGFLLLFLSIGWAFWTDAITIWNWLLVLVSVVTIIFGHVSQEAGSAKETTSSLLYSFFVLVSIVTVYMIIGNHNKSYDVTSLKLHTLSPLSERVVDGLTDPVEVVAFLPLSRHDQMAKFLELYKNESPLFNYRIYDPNIDVTVAQQMDDQILGNDVFILLNKDGEVRQSRIVIDPTDPRREYILTNGLLEAERGESQTVYFTRGKGERAVVPSADNDKAKLESFQAFTDEIEAQLGPVASVNLQTVNRVPEDASLVVIAGISVDLLETEKLMLIDYLDEGGSLLILFDPVYHTERFPNLEAVMNYAGIDSNNTVVIDPQAMSVSPGMTLASSTEEHPIVQNAGDRLFMFNMARPVIQAPDLSPNAPAVVSMLDTSNQVWEENAQRLFRMNGQTTRPDNAEEYYSRSVVATSMWATPNGTRGSRAKVIVYGDSDFLTNQFITQQNMLYLGMSTIAWLSGNEEQVAVPYRDIPPSAFTMTSKRLIVIVIVLLLISGGLLIGGLVYTSTRKRTG